MRLRISRRRVHAIKDPQQGMYMAAQSPATVTKECHPKKGLQEDLQVSAYTKPLAESVIRNGFALVEVEERIVKDRRSALRVVTPIADIQESRSILAHRPIKVDDCGAQGSKRGRRSSPEETLGSTGGLGHSLIAPEKDTRRLLQTD